MSERGGVQMVHLSVEEIVDDVVRLRGSQSRAVLEIGSIGFGLQDVAQQEAILASYAAFLNGLSFPIQILVRVLPIDLSPYLDELERRAELLPEQLGRLARDHGAFVARLARTRTLLERRFYLIVPAQDPDSPRPRWPVRKPVASPDPTAARRQLAFRCEELSHQLGRCGLRARRLSGVELAQLTYRCWCPELARIQRLNRDLAEYTQLVVHPPAP